jgi:hypothetical protein
VRERRERRQGEERRERKREERRGEKSNFKSNIIQLELSYLVIYSILLIS